LAGRRMLRSSASSGRLIELEHELGFGIDL
jgi:hypothetical protein